MAKASKGGKKTVSIEFVVGMLGLPGEVRELTVEEIGKIIEWADNADRAAMFGLSDLTLYYLNDKLSKLPRKADGSVDVPNDDFNPIAAEISMKIGGGAYVSAEDVLPMAAIAKLFPRSFGRRKASFAVYKKAMMKCTCDCTSIEGIKKADLVAAINTCLEEDIKASAKHSDADTEAKVKKAIAVMEERLKELKESGFIEKASYQSLSKFCGAASDITVVCSTLSAAATAIK